MFLISPLHNKIFISIDFEPKKFGRFFRFSANFRSKIFGSKSTEKKILLCKVVMRSKLYEINLDQCFFSMWCLQILLFIKKEKLQKSQTLQFFYYQSWTHFWTIRSLRQSNFRKIRVFWNQQEQSFICGLQKLPKHFLDSTFWHWRWWSKHFSPFLAF